MADDIDDTRHVDDLYTFERNLLAGRATNMGLPSNGVVTSNESDDHREINMRKFIEITARRRLSISFEIKREETVSPADPVVSNRCTYYSFRMFERRRESIIKLKKFHLTVML
jgi:hypothetical protein